MKRSSSGGFFFLIPTGQKKKIEISGSSAEKKSFGKMTDEKDGRCVVFCVSVDYIESTGCSMRRPARKQTPRSQCFTTLDESKRGFFFGLRVLMNVERAVPGKWPVERKRVLGSSPDSPGRDSRWRPTEKVNTRPENPGNP